MAACPHCGHDPQAPAGLTPRQRAVYDFIAHYIGEHGVSPSFREIEAGVGSHSRDALCGQIAALEARGAIRRRAYGARSIELVA